MEDVAPSNFAQANDLGSIRHEPNPLRSHPPDSGRPGLSTAQSELANCEHRSRILRRTIPAAKEPKFKKSGKSDRVVWFIEHNRLGRVLSSNSALPAREKPKVISALFGKAMNQRS